MGGKFRISDRNTEELADDVTREKLVDDFITKSGRIERALKTRENSLSAYGMKLENDKDALRTTEIEDIEETSRSLRGEIAELHKERDALMASLPSLESFTPEQREEILHFFDSEVDN